MTPLRPLLRSSLHFVLLAFPLVGAVTLDARAQAPAASSSQIPAANGSLRGQVADPSGAIIPGATVELSTGAKNYTATTGNDGTYAFRAVAPGTYTLNVTVPGFTPYSSSGIVVAAGSSRSVNVPLVIQTEDQQVQVTAESNTIDTTPDSNASALTIKGKDLDALSDDPDQLQNQLTALAGPAAGPNGAQIYIDGFTGGQLPPKSAIREIRVNQNPFSAEYDKLGYGRIEILTKPGTDKLHGSVQASGNTSAFNALNPFANPTPTHPNIPHQPPYHSYRFQGEFGTALGKHASMSFDAFARSRDDQNIVVALLPGTNPDGSGNLFGTNFQQAYDNPNTRIHFSPRFNVQLGASNTLTVRYRYDRRVDSSANFGGITLQSQAVNIHNLENALQISDTQVISPKLVNDTRFQYRRVRNQQLAGNNMPSVNVQGSFSGGGNNTGVVRDSQDAYEFQNYSTATLGAHTVRFGVRLRALRDANYSTSGSNGSFIFPNFASYYAGTPSQYDATIINNPAARATIFDAGLYYQDDWKAKPNLTLSYGLRFESQNRIRDHADWGPRLGLAWGLGRDSKKPPKSVLRAGYGWFYDRFDVPNWFSANNGAPYVVQTIHENGFNQTNFVVKTGLPRTDGTTFLDPRTLPGAQGQSPTLYQIDHKFHAALNMQAAVGIDRQVTKNITANITYLYSRGIHHYLSDNINAPLPGDFNPTTGEITARPLDYNGNIYQFQSGAVFKQHEIVATGNARVKRFSLFGFYVLNFAHADTNGATYFPSHQTNPGLDYGRASWDNRNRFMLLGNFSLPYQLSLAPIFAANSGNPFNVVIGQDINGDNQYNDRPAFAACGSSDAYTNPASSNPSSSRINGRCFSRASLSSASATPVPYNFGTGPTNYSLNLRVSKVFGIGPRVKLGQGAGTGGGGPHGGGGFHGFNGSGGGPGKLDQAAPRKYNIVLVAYGANLFNHQNLATPNGTLTSPLFDTSQGLAGGFFSPPYPGNRAIDLQATFNF